MIPKTISNTVFIFCDQAFAYLFLETTLFMRGPMLKSLKNGVSPPKT